MSNKGLKAINEQRSAFDASQEIKYKEAYVGRGREES